MHTCICIIRTSAVLNFCYFNVVNHKYVLGNGSLFLFFSTQLKIFEVPMPGGHIAPSLTGVSSKIKSLFCKSNLI